MTPTFAEKVAALGAAHMVTLERVRSGFAARHALVPHFDPDDGGADARVLLLLETPGPGGDPIRFVSRDNPTGTARNIARFCEAAGLARQDTVLWNVVPWVIHAPGARNRAPTRPEIAAGLALLPEVLAALPRLRVIVLCGRVAALAESVTVDRYFAVLRMPHPSPTYVCTSPAIPDRLAATLAEAARLAAEADAPRSSSI